MSISILCKDVIEEILKYCPISTSASFYCVNKYLFKLSVNNNSIKERKRLKSELDKTEESYKKYYRSQILNLKVNDRVTDLNFNYRVLQVDKKTIMLRMVDMLGNKLNDNIVYACIVKDQEKKYYWAISYIDDSGNITIINTLNYGIIKHNFGPLITDVNSHYLDYITKPYPYFLTTHDNAYSPELNMMTTVIYKNNIIEYYISYLTDNYLILNLITNNSNINNKLEAYYKKDTWRIKNHKYKLLHFGYWR